MALLQMFKPKAAQTHVEKHDTLGPRNHRRDSGDSGKGFAWSILASAAAWASFWSLIRQAAPIKPGSLEEDLGTKTYEQIISSSRISQSSNSCRREWRARYIFMHCLVKQSW